MYHEHADRSDQPVADSQWLDPRTKHFIKIKFETQNFPMIRGKHEEKNEISFLVINSNHTLLLILSRKIAWKEFVSYTKQQQPTTSRTKITLGNERVYENIKAMTKARYRF